MSTKKLQLLGSFGDKIYVQADEPTDAEDNAVWIDTDDDGTTTLDGKSAYEIALEYGFEGTEAEWLESLKGKDGDGTGDMTQVVYDIDGNGVVDNAERLGGQLPEYYASKNDIPSVPSKTSEIENDSGFITANDVPTKISELENDSGFITSSEADEKVAALVDSAPDTLNTLNELSNALGNDENFATTVAAQIGEKVPQTRAINGYTLESDISLSASDIGADESGAASMAVNTHNSDTSAHSDLFNDKVPVSRTINGKALSADISLTVDDVGAETSGSVSTHNEAVNAHASLFVLKQDAPLCSTELPTSGTALAANTIYTIAEAIEAYNFVAPASGWAHGTFSISTPAEITFGDGAQFLGEKPGFEEDATFEFDVFNNVWVFAEVVSE